MTARPHPLIVLLNGALVVGGCGLLLLLSRMASGPVLALVRRVSADESVGLSAYWVGAGVVLIGAPLAGWWADQAGRRTSMVVGAAIIAAALTLLTFLHEQAWTALYVVLAFGVVLVGVSATTTVAVIARRAALATAIAFCLPFVRITPAVPPGMRALLDMGERSFAVLGIAFVIGAALPLAAIGLSYAIARRQSSGATSASAAAVAPASRSAVLDANVSLVLILLTGWLTQIGPAAVDLARLLPQDTAQPSVLPAVGVILAGLTSYIWAILADVTTPRPDRKSAGVPTALLMAVAFGIFAIGVGIVLVAGGAGTFGSGMFVASAGAAAVVPIAIAGQLRGLAPDGWAGAVGFAMATFVFGQLAGARINLYLAAWLGSSAPLVVSLLIAAAVAVWLARAGFGPAHPVSDQHPR
jgi:hypothetical protein